MIASYVGWQLATHDSHHMLKACEKPIRAGVNIFTVHISETLVEGTPICSTNRSQLCSTDERRFNNMVS